jgi:lipid II:glycine glycyltransferase (peptidoglycan interpeptide bridge formation enzyme)
VLLIQPSRTDWDTAAHLETRGYQRAPIDVATPATLEVVLGRPDESIVADMAKSRRRNVRRAERRGVVVERGGRSDVRSLELLYAASARRQGFLPMSYDYLLRQWDVLHPAGHLQLFLAKVEGRTLAAGTLLGYGRYAEFKLTGWKATTEAKRCFVNEALNWAMISWANYSGFQVFDLGGLPRQQAIDATQRGIPAVLRGTTSEFKHGWGGSVVVYPPAYQKVLRPLGRLTYELPARLLDDQGLGGRMVNWVRQT